MTPEVAARAIALAVAHEQNGAPTRIPPEMATTMQAHAIRKARANWQAAIRAEVIEPERPRVTPSWWRGSWADWPIARLFAEIVLEGVELGDEDAEANEADANALANLRGAFAAWVGANIVQGRRSVQSIRGAA